MISEKDVNPYGVIGSSNLHTVEVIGSNPITPKNNSLYYMDLRVVKAI